MAKFKCKHSGCVYEFTDESTIKTMQTHAEYEEVSPMAPVVAQVPVATKPKKETK